MATQISDGLHRILQRKSLGAGVKDCPSGMGPHYTAEKANACAGTPCVYRVYYVPHQHSFSRLFSSTDFPPFRYSHAPFPFRTHTLNMADYPLQANGFGGAAANDINAASEALLPSFLRHHQAAPSAGLVNVGAEDGMPRTLYVLVLREFTGNLHTVTSNCVFRCVGNLDANVSEELISSLFGQIGLVTKSKVVFDVSFSTTRTQEACQGIFSSDMTLEGLSKLRCQFKSETIWKPEGPSRRT